MPQNTSIKASKLLFKNVLISNCMVNYQEIKKEAKIFAEKTEKELPKLPNNKSLEKYMLIIESELSELVEQIKKHLGKKSYDVGHGFEHLYNVAVLAAYIAELECKEKQLSKDTTKRLIRRTIIAGLLHDIERYRGFRKNHAIEGSKIAKLILKKCNIKDDYVPDIILHHDEKEFAVLNNIEFDIPFGSVFDADHFNYGLERKESFWIMKEKGGMPPEDVIHDYKFLYEYRNALKTSFGKKAGPRFIDFGIKIAKHIEQKFSQ